MITIPPTPTYMGPGTAHFTIPSSYSLWASTNAAVQYWHFIGTAGVIFQGIIVLILVYIGIRLTLRFVRDFTHNDAEE